MSYESTIFQIEGEEGDGLGRTVLSCGDRNQDGYDDVAVSVKFSDYLVENAGSIHILRTVVWIIYKKSPNYGAVDILQQVL